MGGGECAGYCSVHVTPSHVQVRSLAVSPSAPPNSTTVPVSASYAAPESKADGGTLEGWLVHELPSHIHSESHDVTTTWERGGNQNDGMYAIGGGDTGGVRSVQVGTDPAAEVEPTSVSEAPTATARTHMDRTLIVYLSRRGRR